MSRHEVVYYQDRKKQTRIVDNVTKISKEKNLLKFTIENGDDVVFLMSNVLSYKKIG